MNEVNWSEIFNAVFEIDQLIIAITGVVAIWLTQGSEKQQKWACIIGLLGEPAWFYTSWINEQYGIFILCSFYTFAWMRGIKRYWFRR